jgi:hypothetical protein
LESGFQATFSKNSALGQALNGRRDLKENVSAATTGVRKLKRKAVVN